MQFEQWKDAGIGFPDFSRKNFKGFFKNDIQFNQH